MSENCPQCNGPGPLFKVEVGLKLSLESVGQGAIPTSVCGACIESLSGQVSQGVKLRIEEEAKHKNKVQLWKNRVTFVKQGRQFLLERAYPEAAMSYEKYIKILEMVYEVDSGNLNPEIFSNSKKSKEMTIILSVYWDLVKIYDTSKRYQKRLTKAVDKVLVFGKYSSLFANIVKKAEQFNRSAKNPEQIKRIIIAGKGKTGCWIATASFNGPYAPEVIALRNFRDRYLIHSNYGQLFIKYYYLTSPYLARIIEKSNLLKFISRIILKLFIKVFSM